MICICCGKDKETLPLKSAFSQEYQACHACIQKYTPQSIAVEADRLMVELQRTAKPQCAKCGTPTLYINADEARLYCDTCERKIRNQFNLLLRI